MQMAKRKRSPPKKALAEPLVRTKRLAERMARVLKDTEVSDAAVAVAFLTSGVVTHYANNPDSGTELFGTIRKMEDRLLAGSLGPDESILQ